jgi:hypothetical protein
MTHSNDRTTPPQAVSPPGLLPPAVEHLLTHPDAAEGSDADWERMADAIAQRIENISPGHGDDEDWLFQSPLPLCNGELVLRADGSPRVQLLGSGVESRVEDERPAPIPSDHRSLKEIAEAALAETKRATPSVLPHRSPARSGVQLVALAESATTPGESMAPPVHAPAALPSSARAEANPSNAVHEAVPSKAVPTPTQAQPKRPAWLVGSLALMATLPVAAAVALWLVGRAPETRSESEVVAAVSVQPPPLAVARAAKPESEPLAEAPAVHDSKPVEQADEAAADESAAAPQEVAMLPLDSASRPPAKARVATRPHKSAAAAAAPQPPSAAPERTEPPLIPAADLGSRPSHPSIGAAQAAVGSTLGSARLCIVGQFSASQATVTFGSNGRVLSVHVSGPAAGSAAETCIQRAMGQARVQPFSDESFSVRTTVRP